MQIRDRIKELRRVPAKCLAPHPLNWRRHPGKQRQGMLAVLRDVGYADALVARELPDGRLQILDGHLRAEATPDALAPVLVVDLDDQEAERFLLTHDALCGMAEVDQQAVDALVATVATESDDLAALLREVQREFGAPGDTAALDRPEIEIPATYQVVVDCETEDQQRDVYQQMRKEGRRCRVLTL